ncbi:MAG: CxxxxCH/CxxCH domain c-type cytochrome [Thermodesulfovibrionales bacterium]
MRKVKGMNWKAKISLVLVFTLVFSTFMYQGWYQPKPADAAPITVLTQFSSTPCGVGTTGATTSNISCTSPTVGAGSNRVLVLVVTGEAGGNHNPASTSATFGAASFTTVQNSYGANDNRRYAWIGYINESQIAANSGSNINITLTSNQTWAGAEAFYAVYGGVDQGGGTATVPGSAQAGDAGTTQTVAMGPITTVADGVAIYGVSDNTTTAGATVPTNYTEHVDVADSSGNYLTVIGSRTSVPAATESVSFTVPAVRWRSVYMSLAPISCTDTDLATLTTTAPTSSATVSGATYTIQTQVGTEATPSGMTGMAVTIAGSTGCNVTSQPMTWNGATSRWEYTWNIAACGNPADGGISINVTGTDPDCSTAVNAPAITNVTIDNTCSDADPATAVTVTPATSASVNGTVTVTGAITGETTPGTGSASLTITGSDTCNVTGQAMSWNAGTSKWEYAWNTAACGTVTPDTGVSVQVTYTDPDCAGATVVSGISTNVTINNTDPSKITSCAGCHGYGAGFSDGTARNTPTGLFPGSHNKHVASYGKVCSVCHTVPATEDSASFGHRDGTVQIASPINGLSGSTYSKTSFTQANSFTPGTCSNTYCHSNGTSATTPAGSVPANTSIAWGSAGVCNSCHGSAADGRPNYTPGTPKANAHQASTHAAQTCDICHDSVTYSGGVYTPDTALHVNATYNLNASLGYTPGTAAAGGVCATPACHGSINWGGSMGCIDCHNVAINSPIAQALDAAVTQRRAITPDFAKTQSHKRSASGAISDSDCGVCHMEGTASSGAINATYHKNGRIELRDPDTGTTIKGVTWGGTGAGSWSSTANDATPVRFSRNLGALESYTDNQNAMAIMVNQCLHCHDTNGANNASARVTGGTALKPFNTTVAANPSGGVLDVASQFATTNRTYHPILGKQNNSYTANTRMAAPWNITKTTGNNTSWGNLMTCWDCHAPNGSTNATTLVATDVHGSTITTRTGSSPSVELRGFLWTNQDLSTVPGTAVKTTLCIACHAGYDGFTTDNHSGGGTSAFGSGGSSSMNNFIQYDCSYCHASSPTKPARPLASGDVHGYNTLVGGGALATNFGYSFIRAQGFVGTYTWVPGNCTGYTSSTNGTTTCSRSSMGTYTPGGTY